MKVKVKKKKEPKNDFNVIIKTKRKSLVKQKKVKRQKFISRMIKKSIILILLLSIIILSYILPKEIFGPFNKSNISFQFFPSEIYFYFNKSQNIPNKLYLLPKFEQNINQSVNNSNNITINPYYDNYQLVAHRGGIGAPDNTLVAFNKAIERGFHMLECDIVFTKDDIPIVFHDTKIVFSNNRKGIPVSSLKYAEMSNYDFSILFPEYPEYKNEKIPTLKEFLFLIKEKGIIAEFDLTKISHTFKQLKIIYSIVNELDMKGSVVFTGYKDQLSKLSEIDNNIIISISNTFNLKTMKQYEQFAKSFVRATFSCNKDWVNNEMLEFSLESGIPIKVWTLEDKDRAIELFKKGVKHILSDSIMPFDYPKPIKIDLKKPNILLICETKRLKTKCSVTPETQKYFEKNKEYSLYYEDSNELKKFITEEENTIKYLSGEGKNINTPEQIENSVIDGKKPFILTMTKPIGKDRKVKGKIAPEKEIVSEDFIFDILCKGEGNENIKCHLVNKKGKLKTHLNYVLANFEII